MAANKTFTVFFNKQRGTPSKFPDNTPVKVYGTTASSAAINSKLLAETEITVTGPVWKWESIEVAAETAESAATAARLQLGPSLAEAEFSVVESSKLELKKY